MPINLKSQNFFIMKKPMRGAPMPSPALSFTLALFTCRSSSGVAGGKEEVTTHNRSTEHDDDSDIACTANFCGGENSESKMNVHVK
ncbi:hypothetical protein Z043_123947, partial [Scleropages formosus]